MAELVNGSLQLGFEYDAKLGHTVLKTCRQQPPLRVVRSFETGAGGALVHLHNLSGGVLGGDKLALEVEVGPEAYAQLTSTGATRLYRSGPHEGVAVQTNRVVVAENGLLEYLPDPLIPFGGSRYRQETKIELATGAGLFWWETVAPGREAKGELFEYGSLQLNLDLVGACKPLVSERVWLEPAVRGLDSSVRLGGYRYFATFLICKVGWQRGQWRTLENQLSELGLQLSKVGEIVWGVSTLTTHGLVIRAVSQTGRAISTGLIEFWKLAKYEVYGQEAVVPRKVY